MPKRLTYGTLPVNPIPSVLLFCSSCPESYSATRGDYFLQNPEHSPRCAGCDRRLKLVQVVITHKLVEPAAVETRAKPLRRGEVSRAN